MSAHARYLVMAGSTPGDKGIHDAQFGHYGVTFATVSFAHEYSHMPEYGAKMATEYAERIAAALNEHESMLALLRRIEPHIDAIVCYASTMGEHEPNRIAFDVRAAIAKATENTR